METRPGYRTTEFWITVIVQIAAVCAALADALPARYAAIVSAISAAAYAIARGLSKSGVKPDPVTPPRS